MLYYFASALRRKFKLILGLFFLALTIYFFLFHEITELTEYKLSSNSADNIGVYVSYDFIELILYDRVISSVLKKKGHECTYEHVLQNMNHLEPRDVSMEYSGFSAAGIVNGTFSPEDCNPLFSVAILVPYRNRNEHLDVFLPYMHNFLRRQDIHYKIYLIEQRDDKPFNKGLLYNLGADAAIADGFPCLILHDVDLLPLDYSNLYVCAKKPRHAAAIIDKFNYHLYYDWLVGGVLAIRTDQYKRLNGFSHRFWGWGGEDDDLFMRMREQRMQLIRFPPSMSRYTMLYHTPRVRNPGRMKQLTINRHEPQSARAQDGLQGVQEAPALVRRTDRPLYTLLVVNITQGPNETFTTQTTRAEK